MYTGYHTLSTEPYLPPENLDYILLSADDPITFSSRGFLGLDNYKNIQAVLASGNWEIWRQLDKVLALRKTLGATRERLQLVKAVSDDNSEALLPVISSGESAPIRLVGFRCSDSCQRTRDGVLPITLYWSKLQPDHRDYDLWIELGRKSVVLFSGRLAPGKRIQPPQSWPVGVLLEENIVLPLKIEQGDGSDLVIRAELLCLQ